MFHSCDKHSEKYKLKIASRKYYERQARLSLKFSWLSLCSNTQSSWPKTRFSMLVPPGQFFVYEAQREGESLSKIASNAAQIREMRVKLLLLLIEYRPR